MANQNPTLYPWHFKLRTSHSRIPTSRSTPGSTSHTLHITFPIQHSTVYTPYFTLCTPPHFTFHSLHWYRNRGTMYKTVETNCFAQLFQVAAFGLVGWLVGSWLVLFFYLQTFRSYVLKTTWPTRKGCKTVRTWAPPHTAKCLCQQHVTIYLVLPVKTQRHCEVETNLKCFGPADDISMKSWLVRWPPHVTIASSCIVLHLCQAKEHIIRAFEGSKKMRVWCGFETVAVPWTMMGLTASPFNYSELPGCAWSGHILHTDHQVFNHCTCFPKNLCEEVIAKWTNTWDFAAIILDHFFPVFLVMCAK